MILIPRTVKDVVFDMIVAGDYNISVIGVSTANQAESDSDIQEWIKTEDGHLQMPYRDVIQAPGNYGQSSDYTDNRAALLDNPTAWEGEGETQKGPISLRCCTGRAPLRFRFGRKQLEMYLSGHTTQLTENINSILLFLKIR